MHIELSYLQSIQSLCTTEGPRLFHWKIRKSSESGAAICESEELQFINALAYCQGVKPALLPVAPGH